MSSPAGFLEALGAAPTAAPWLGALRESGRTAFAGAGFPTTRHEEWKYTNVAAIARSEFALGATADDAVAGLDASLDLGGTRVAFANGIWVDAASRMPPAGSGLVVARLHDKDLASTAEAHLGRLLDPQLNGFVALNTAALQEGCVVHVPRGVVVEEPIEILHYTSAPQPLMTLPRVLVVLEEGAQAHVVERFVGSGESAYFTCAMAEVVLGPGARLRHDRVQNESELSYHIGAVAVQQHRDSAYQSLAISVGGQIARTDVLSRLQGEGAECDFDGLYLARGKQHVDHHTAVDHAVPHCTSRELYKGILDDSSTGVFNGKVFVREDAQKSDAQQMNRNLLLSESATVDTKPQLEILADDVKCSHGATVGRLDESALFYLRSRGIPADRARQMLIVAFANEMIGRLPMAPLREELEVTIANRLGRA